MFTYKYINSEFKTVILDFEIDLESHLMHSRRLGKYIGFYLLIFFP